MAILNTEITQDIEEPFLKSATFHFDKSAKKGKKITYPKTEKNHFTKVRENVGFNLAKRSKFDLNSDL